MAKIFLVICSIIPGFVFGYVSIPSYLFSPWIEPALEPSWDVRGTYLHGTMKNHASEHALDLSLHGRVSLPSSLQIDGGFSLGKVGGGIGYPLLSVAIKKQYLNDIAPKGQRSPMALGFLVDGSITTRERVHTLIFQEWGRAQTGFSLLLGKHIAPFKKDRYTQVYGVVRLGYASGGVSSVLYGLSAYHRFSRFQSALIRLMKSHGNGEIRGSMGTKQKSLSPEFHEISLEYGYLVPSLGTFSISFAQKWYTTHDRGRFCSVQLCYKKYFSI